MEKSVQKIPRNFSILNVFKGIIFSFMLLSFFFVVVPSIYVLSNYNKNLVEQKDCAVVFGAAVWKGDTPSHALFDRTISGINLYKNNQVECLVFSGGKSKYGSHEADVMKKIALENKISEKDIFLDLNGNNTLQTIQNISKNFAGKSFVFVSNDFHLGRIKMIAHKLDIKDFAVHKAKYNQGKYFKNHYFFAREVLGISYYFLFL